MADVLIVPLWNWNRGAAQSVRTSVCLNRTFMELKLNTLNLNLEETKS